MRQPGGGGVGPGLSGLAEHVTSTRRLLHDGSRAELTHLGVRVLLAGLRAELL